MDLTEWQRRRFVADGWLRPVAPRSTRYVAFPRHTAFASDSDLLSLGERSWVSYEAAALLHGLDRSRPNAVEFTVDRNRRNYGVPFTVHSTKMLKPVDLVEVDGFRAMSATRTIVDLAHARAHPQRVEAAIDSAVRLGLSSPEVIAERLETLRGSGRWGCRLIDDLIVDSGGHTMLERRFLQLVREAGLPRPRTQVVHRKNGRHIARVDFLFDEAGVVVEVSGRLGHSTPSGASPRCSAPQRATGHRPPCLRVHLGRRHRTAGVRPPIPDPAPATGRLIEPAPGNPRLRQEVGEPGLRLLVANVE